MRIATPAIVVAVVVSALAPAHAWERKTVGADIESFCEGRFPDDWPGQQGCIEIQWKALKAIRPPVAPELAEALKQCKAGLESEFDFSALDYCYQRKMEATSGRRAVVAFNQLPLLATCPGDIEIRSGKGGPWDIFVRVGDGEPMEGKKGDYVYDWGKDGIEVEKCK